MTPRPGDTELREPQPIGPTEDVDVAIGAAILDTDHIPGMARKGPYIRAELAKYGWAIVRALPDYVGELQLFGAVVIGQSDTDPGDMGEPRTFTADGTTYVTVPSFALWHHVALLDRVAALETALRQILPEVMDRELGSVIGATPQDAIAILTAKADRWMHLRDLLHTDTLGAQPHD